MLSRLWKDPGCVLSRNRTAENGATGAETLAPGMEGHAPEVETVEPEVEGLSQEAEEVMPELRFDVTVPVSCVK